MENKSVEKEHLRKSVKDVQIALKNILEDIEDNSNSSYWLMTLLCRVGELELCLNYNSDLKKYKEEFVELKQNRLCECYEKLGGDQFET